MPGRIGIGQGLSAGVGDLVLVFKVAVEITVVSGKSKKAVTAGRGQSELHLIVRNRPVISVRRPRRVARHIFRLAGRFDGDGVVLRSSRFPQEIESDGGFQWMRYVGLVLRGGREREEKQKWQQYEGQ